MEKLRQADGQDHRRAQATAPAERLANARLLLGDISALAALLLVAAIVEALF